MYYDFFKIFRILNKGLYPMFKLKFYLLSSSDLKNTKFILQKKDCIKLSNC